MKKVPYFLVVVLLTWSAALFADLRITSETKINVAVDTTMGAYFPMRYLLEQVLWVNLEKRCAQIDTKDGESCLLFADSMDVEYKKSEEFENYTRMVVAGDKYDQDETFSAGFTLIPSAPIFQVDTTGETKIISRFCCQQVVVTNVQGGDTMRMELWLTDEVVVPHWVIEILVTGPPIRIAGFPILTILAEQNQKTVSQITEVTEASPPPNAYIIPAHFEKLKK